jgi:pimeloyl-ACP methyl ester carboxylesterase
VNYRHTFKSTLVEIEDAELEVWEAGDGPVTFVASHPYRANSDPHPGGSLSDALANIGRCYWICGRDVGRSTPERREEKLTMHALADDSEQVRRALGVEKWIPAGTSTGGCVALFQGLEHAAGVQALVLIGTGPSWHFIEEPYSIYNPRNPVFQRLAQLEREHNGGDVWRRAMLEASVHNHAVVDTLMNEIEIHRPRLEAIRKEIVEERWDDSHRLSTITVPTLVVNGRYDWQSGSLHPAFELVEGIPTAQLALMNKSGHMPYAEEPEAFEYAVRHFIDHTVLGPGPSAA